MSTDTRFAGLLGAWPPSDTAPLLDPAQGRMQGLLPAPSADASRLGLLEVPGDPSSLFGPAPDAAGGVQAGNDLGRFAAQIRALQTIRDQLGDPLGWFAPAAGQAAPAPAETVAPSTAPTIDPTYRVQPGDNLSSIGGSYVASGLYPDIRTAVGALARANRLASGAILPGQALSIPSAVSATDAEHGGRIIAAESDAAAAAQRRARPAAAANDAGLIRGLPVNAAAAAVPLDSAPVFALSHPAAAAGTMSPSELALLGGAALSPAAAAQASRGTDWGRQAGEVADVAANLVSDGAAGLGEGAVMAGGPRAAERLDRLDKVGRIGDGLTLLGAGAKTYADVDGDVHSPDLVRAAVHNFTPAIFDVGAGYAGGRLGAVVGGPEGAIGGGFLGGIARPQAQNWWNSELMTLKLPGGPALVGQQLANLRAGVG